MEKKKKKDLSLSLFWPEGPLHLPQHDLLLQAARPASAPLPPPFFSHRGPTLLSRAQVPPLPFPLGPHAQPAQSRWPVHQQPASPRSPSFLSPFILSLSHGPTCKRYLLPP